MRKNLKQLLLFLAGWCHRTSVPEAKIEVTLSMLQCNDLTNLQICFPSRQAAFDGWQWLMINWQCVFSLSSCLSFLFRVHLSPFSHGETGAQRRAGPLCGTPYVHAPGTCCQSGAHPAAFSWAVPPIGRPSVQLPSRPGRRLRTWPATPAGPLPLPRLPVFPAPVSPPGPQLAPPTRRLPHDVPPELCPCSSSCSSPALLPAYAAQPRSQP